MRGSRFVVRGAGLVLALGAAWSVRAGNAANPNAIDLTPIPRPVAFACDMDRPVAFDRTTTLTLDCPDPGAAAWLARHFEAWYGKEAPRIVRGGVRGGAGGGGTPPLPKERAGGGGTPPLPGERAGGGGTPPLPGGGAGGGGTPPLPGGEEAYAVEANASGVRIAARTLAGVRWAAYTLRPLAFARRGTFTTQGRLLPTLTASDAPHLAFRGIHLCWLPEVRPAQIERSIRLAAQMKFNYCVLEPWGMFASEKNPWWGWPNGKMTPAEVRRLVEIGRDLGITLIPQIPAFGHAALARSCTIKHAVLDLRPEYEPLFEPGGWNWCLTNPETQRVLRELIAELHDCFGRPPYVHLGCDEAQPPTCPDCRKRPYGELVCEHISGLVEFVRTRGAKAMIWHDMLLKEGDPRWKGFVAMGSAQTATLADTLPKDVILCDWQYSYGDMRERRKDWPTMGYFLGKGFPVVGCPWMNYNAMRPMADFLAAKGGFGYLQTTWHHLRRDDFRRMFVSGSSAAWGGGELSRNGFHGTAPLYDSSLAIALRLIGHDMKVSDPLDTGDCNYQVPPAWWHDN